jgi:hypothetical protein
VNYFASLDASREYLDLLIEVLGENLDDVCAQEEQAEGRMKDALRVIRYKMLVGAEHLKRAEKVLRDLERLRNLLLPGEYDGWGA